MRAVAGYLLLMAALTFGAVEFYLTPADREAFMAAIPRSPSPSVETPSAKGVRAPHSRSFAPSSSLFAEVVYALTREPEIASALGENATALDAAAPVALERPAPLPGWSTVVTMDSQPANGRGALTPGDDGKLYQLTLELQRELRRVGCYYGHLNGHWGTTSKNAIGEFVRRVNAALPFERPDYALLNLVRGHSGLVCGTNCPPGDVMARDGRCLASTVLARRPSDAIKSAEAAVPAPVPARRPVAPLPGRMAIGAPPGAASNAGTAPMAEEATGYLDPTAAIDRPDPEEAFTAPPLPRDPSPLASSPRFDRSRPVWRASRSEPRGSRRRSGVSRHLPHNRRYIPPPNQLGLVR